MLDGQDSDSLIAEIIMASEGSKLVLLVEGDLDEYFFMRFVDDSVVSPVNARGKTRILSVENRLEALEDAVLVVLDKDFDGLLETKVASKEVVYLDHYNLESMLLSEQSTFSVLWRIYVAIHNPKHNEQDAFKCCIEAASLIGRIRYLGIRQGYGVSLNGFKSDTVDFDYSQCFSINLDRLLDVVVRSSKKSRLWTNMKRRHRTDQEAHRATIRRLKRELAKLLKSETRSESNFASGHDLSKTLNLIAGRSSNHHHPKAQTIEKQAAEIFPADKFLESSVAKSMESEARRQGFDTLWSAEV